MKKEITKQISRVRKEATDIASLNTVRQKRCWALVVNDIQKYVHLEIDWNDFDDVRRVIPFDKYGKYKIEIDPSLVISKNHSYTSVLESLKKLTEVWVHTSDPLTKENTYFALFPSYNEDQGHYYLHLSFFTLRWFIFLKRGNYTSFHLNSFLSLSSTYSMDLYLFLSEYYNMDNRVVIISLEDFKHRMNCPVSYDYKDIKTRVLEPSFNEFERTSSLLTFRSEAFSSKMELEKRSKGRKKIDMLKFTIIKRNDVK